MAHVRTVSVGTPQDRSWAGKLGSTAIDKHSVDGPVRVHQLGVEGDQVADTVFHGGVDQAVYVVGREDLDHWAAELGRPIDDGMFGENLTTQGIDVNEALVGERWRIGSVLLEVSSVRIPCSVFANWLSEHDYDSTRWVKRYTQHRRPGPYLRVLEEGTLQAGDTIEVEHRPDHGITVSTMFEALTLDRALQPRLLEIDGLAPSIREQVETYVAGQASS